MFVIPKLIVIKRQKKSCFNFLAIGSEKSKQKKRVKCCKIKFNSKIKIKFDFLNVYILIYGIYIIIS